jgi:RNA polymerase sigma-70 factor (ECF subfamily)
VFTISDPEPLSESDLGNQLAGTSPQQFSDWLRPHWAAMACLARRQCAAADWEDVLQEALSSAWRKRGQFDPDRGTARNWLLSITADQARKSYRKLRVVPSRELAEHSTSAADQVHGLDLERALGTLTSRQRLAVNLRYFVGLPIADIALVMGCSEGTAKSTLSDARRNIRTQLGEGYR